jgi:CRP/FNR family cyclic AMP-dependent transcriptional regulator
LEFFQTLSIFDGIGRVELLDLIEKSSELHFKKGDLIRREGQKPDAFYLIIQGMVNITKISMNGNEFTIDCQFRGEPLGWGQVLRGGFFTATFYALDDTDLLSFGKENFIAFIERNPIIMSRISNLNIDLINVLFNKLIDVSCDTAGNRLIRTLITLNIRCGNTINLTHLDIAKMSWTTLETTTRVLTKLKKDNILSIDRGKIIIKEPEKIHLYIENQTGKS